MKKILVLVLLATLGQSVYASHPHERVCLVTVNNPAEPISSFSFLFQYSIGRTYTEGDSSKDPHDVAAQASYSVGDYLDNPATKYLSELATIGPKDKRVIPLTLTAVGDAKNILFVGEFDLDKETLKGTFADANQTKITSEVKMNCISRPGLNLEPTEKDILEQAPIK